MSCGRDVGQISVKLDSEFPAEHEGVLVRELRAVLTRSEMLFRFGRPSYFSFVAPVEIEIRGFNLELLRRLGNHLAEQMNEIRGIRDVKASTEGGSPELLIRFDRERIASMGLSQVQIANTIRSKVLGTVATDVQRQERTVDIRVRAHESFRDSVGAVDGSDSGRGRWGWRFRLSAVARVEQINGPAEIRRSEGDRVALVTAI